MLRRAKATKQMSWCLQSEHSSWLKCCDEYWKCWLSTCQEQRAEEEGEKVFIVFLCSLFTIAGCSLAQRTESHGISGWTRWVLSRNFAVVTRRPQECLLSLVDGLIRSRLSAFLNDGGTRMSGWTLPRLILLLLVLPLLIPLATCLR